MSRTSVQRSAIESAPPPETAPPTETTMPPVENAYEPLGTTLAGSSIIPTPETCPPPEAMPCPVPNDTPGTIAHTVHFAQGSAVLSTSEKSSLDALAASWDASRRSGPLRMDGYASAEGGCEMNWDLSCRRARAVRDELARPADGSPGVPSAQLEHFANGESDTAGTTLAPNRRVTIAMPSIPPPPPPSPPPSCPLPHPLGSARGCGSGADFAHFDFPSISASSTAKLAAWAALHPPHIPSRRMVSDADCIAEMTSVLTGLAGGAGLAAMSRFLVGTGGTATHTMASTLGSAARTCGSFLATVATVQADIERQLAAQAPSGALDPCRLAVTPPATHFQFSDGVALKAVIGGTQGEELFLNSFSGNVALRTYSLVLRFKICDDFGVDESDLYAPGLMAFWVLQHERSSSLYKPFINELDLTVPLRGTF